MGFWDKLKGELIDIIEWTDRSRDTMMHRFERHGNEIKHGAKLTVREGQAAVFVNEGRIADVFEPGMYELQTRNLPILSTLQGWKHGFESPFKAEVYFVSTRRFTDQKWGTKNPFVFRDPELGAVRLRAFGAFDIKVSDPATFLREVVGTDGQFRTDEIMERIRSKVVSSVGAMIGEAKIPLLDLLGHYDDLEAAAPERLREPLSEMGLSLPALTIENISAPPEVEEMLDKRAGMKVVGDVQADMGAFTRFQTAQAIDDAAQNQGMTGAGVGMGAGFAMGQTMAQAMQPGVTARHAETSQEASPVARIAGIDAINAGERRPPPLPGASGGQPVYVALDGKQAGPFTAEALGDLAASGRLTRTTLVWKQGMAQWAAASTVPETAALLAAAPPPLPG